MATYDPRFGYATAGIAGQSSDTINAPTEPVTTGDNPPIVTVAYPVGADLSLEALEVVGFDGAGNIVPAEYAAVAGAKATGALTFSNVGSAAETVTIGTRVYTLVAALTGAANEVLIGASATATALNLKNAINADEDTLDVTHGAETDHPSVVATSALGVVTVTAKQAGTAANSVATAEVSAVAAWGAATLTGGTGAQASGVQAIGIVAAAIDNEGGAAGDVYVEVHRWGMFNPNVLVWDESFDTDAKKRPAFEGAPSPTNIFVRKPVALTV
jgi:hypothetical protein